MDLLRRRDAKAKRSVHRGRKGDPSIGSGTGWSWHQNASTTAVRNASKGFFELVTPYREMRDTWSAKESVRDIYQIGDRTWLPSSPSRCQGISKTDPSHRR